MRNILMSTSIIALVLLATAWSTAAQTMQGKELAAVTLTGATEVPGPGDSDGSGTAKLTLNVGKGEVCYELTVANIQEATAAHIHEGAIGKSGPVKVGLDAPKTGTAKGCKSADTAVIQDLMQNPANYYVNVHNAEFPQGAVRGQLSK
jgi:CHRD domain